WGRSSVRLPPSLIARHEDPRWCRRCSCLTVPPQEIVRTVEFDPCAYGQRAGPVTPSLIGGPKPLSRAARGGAGRGAWTLSTSPGRATVRPGGTPTPPGHSYADRDVVRPL